VRIHRDLLYDVTGEELDVDEFQDALEVAIRRLAKKWRVVTPALNNGHEDRIVESE